MMSAEIQRNMDYSVNTLKSMAKFVAVGFEYGVGTAFLNMFLGVSLPK